MDNFFKIIVIFVVYVFVVFLGFFILAEPVVTPILNAFGSIESSAAQVYLDNQVDISRTVVKIFFSLFLGLPFAWLVGVIFSRETTFGYERRY